MQPFEILLDGSVALRVAPVFVQAMLSAYLDPGSGSLLFQLLIAFLMVLLFWMKSLRNLLGKLFRRQPPPERSAPIPKPPQSNNESDSSR